MLSAFLNTYRYPTVVIIMIKTDNTNRTILNRLRDTQLGYLSLYYTPPLPTSTTTKKINY